MEHLSLTSQTSALFKRANSQRIPLAGVSKESHSDQLSDAHALDPRLSACVYAQAGLRKDDGQGNWSLLSARKRARHKSAE